jgi:hypothetical protein
VALLLSPRFANTDTDALPVLLLTRVLSVLLVPSNLKLVVTSVSHALLDNSVPPLESMEMPKSTRLASLVTSVKKEIPLETLLSELEVDVLLVSIVMLVLVSLENVILARLVLMSH